MNPAEACFSARFLKRRRLREVCWWICVCVSAGCSAEADVNAGHHSCSLKRKRRRFIVATGSSAAIATLRFEVATGTSREKRLHCFVLATGYPAAGIVSCATSFGFQQLWELFKEDLVFEFVVSFPILRNFQPFVPYPSNPRTMFSRELFRRFPGVSDGCFARARLRGRAVIPHSHLPAGIVATMRRVVNYHSSWARQQQVELVDASGNPGSTADRGFNPAGGAPGGG
ncbi:hypothetical protein F511_13170 [Dorcoceras hygrometricum]|uniref:Uncharacterized protein n=1 Tax=Dorcoceras hygrometricum TaxID=472368 RepID=A0A2Z7BGV3_9LAMI|nr:hypothetical protein F511_13170 [Dorcoceras hygrometricum]